MSVPPTLLLYRYEDVFSVRLLAFYRYLTKPHDCPTTRAWHQSFSDKFFSASPANAEDITKLWFLGRSEILTVKPCLIIFLGIILFQYCIWEEKLRKRKPSYNTLKTMYIESFSTIVRSRKKLINMCQLVNEPLCRLICPLLYPAPLALDDDGG